MTLPYDIQRERDEEMRREARRDEDEERLEAVRPEHACVCVQLSGCCSAPPYQIEVLESNPPKPGDLYTGTCGQCLDNCDFEPLFERDDISTTWKLVDAGAMGRDSRDKTWEYEFECTNCGAEAVTQSERYV